jgi:hypothetical protein
LPAELITNLRTFGQIIASGFEYFCRPALARARPEFQRVHQEGIRAELLKQWNTFLDVEKLDWDRRRQEWDGAKHSKEYWGRRPEQKTGDKTLVTLPLDLFEKCWRTWHPANDSEKQKYAKVLRGSGTPWQCMLCPSAPMAAKPLRHLLETHALEPARPEVDGLAASTEGLRCPWCLRAYTRAENCRRHVKNGSCPLDPRPDKGLGTEKPAESTSVSVLADVSSSPFSSVPSSKFAARRRASTAVGRRVPVSDLPPTVSSTSMPSSSPSHTIQDFPTKTSASRPVKQLSQSGQPPSQSRTPYPLLSRHGMFHSSTSTPLSDYHPSLESTYRWDRSPSETAHQEPQAQGPGHGCVAPWGSKYAYPGSLSLPSPEPQHQRSCTDADLRAPGRGFPSGPEISRPLDLRRLDDSAQRLPSTPSDEEDEEDFDMYTTPDSETSCGHVDVPPPSTMRKPAAPNRRSEAGVNVCPQDRPLPTLEYQWSRSHTDAGSRIHTYSAHPSDLRHVDDSSQRRPRTSSFEEDDDENLYIPHDRGPSRRHDNISHSFAHRRLPAPLPLPLPAPAPSSIFALAQHSEADLRLHNWTTNSIYNQNRNHSSHFINYFPPPIPPPPPLPKNVSTSRSNHLKRTRSASGMDCRDDGDGPNCDAQPCRTHQFSSHRLSRPEPTRCAEPGYAPLMSDMSDRTVEHSLPREIHHRQTEMANRMMEPAYGPPSSSWSDEDGAPEEYVCHPPLRPRSSPDSPGRNQVRYEETLAELPSSLMPPQDQAPATHAVWYSACKKVITGVRYKCMHPSCHDYDLCTGCEALPMAVHPDSHPLLKVKRADTVILIVSNGSTDSSRLIMMQGPGKSDTPVCVQET